MNFTYFLSSTQEQDFLTACHQVLAFEGDISDDPQDPGGLTRYGISQRAYPQLKIRELSRAEAINIYRRDYWQACSCQLLPSPLNRIVFDAAVNQGVKQAIIFLQKALSVPADGVIGTKTLNAIANQPIEAVVLKVLVARALHYASLSEFPRFGQGWFARLFKLALSR